ncbi:MAG: hypothetical protein Q8904_01560 [Bacteroidota bacterium]|nr:hypothetical protein [Bacteroidota bacterium]
MKDLELKLLLVILLFGFYSFCFGQPSATWNKLDGLLGEWVGEGAGLPGQGNGSFTFKYDLDKKILVRKSHTEFPKTENKAAIIHDDLTVIYPDYSGNPSKAIYFDNEGHTINYTVLCSEDTITFTSNKIPNVPVFRLTYTLLDNETMKTKFEMSQDGDKFSTYL